MMKNSKDLLGSVVKTAQMGKTGLECVPVSYTHLTLPTIRLV